MTIRTLGALACALLLTACSMMPEFPWLRGKGGDPAWREQRAKIENIHKWSAMGRVAINTDEKAWNVRMHWEQEGDDYRIRLNGPFGSGAANIVGGPNKVALQTTDNRLFSASDPESLLFDVMGWHIPLSGLRYWILGRPEPNTLAVRLETDVDGKLKRLEQSGWDIRYLNYKRVDNLELPVWLILENPRLSARIRINVWTLAPHGANQPDEAIGHDIGHDIVYYEPGHGKDTVQTMSIDPSLTKVSMRQRRPEKEEAESPCEKKKWSRSIPLLGKLVDKVICAMRGP